MWTSWAPVGRLGWPEDQARVALFLASDLSAFVTGHNIPVDGGTLAGGGWFYSPTDRRFVNRPTASDPAGVRGRPWAPSGGRGCARR